MSFIASKKRLIISVFVLAVTFVLISIPFGPLPPLEKLLNPASGIWAPNISPYATGIHEINITQNGSTSSVTVFNEPDGFIGIASNTTWGMYYEQGYLEAQYRLAQMEVIKREALGTLSGLVGASELSSDIFFRQLEDLQIAQQEVSNLSKTGLTYKATAEFVDGINAYISNLSQANMPLLFKVLDFTPNTWNITDVFAIQQLFLWENSAGGTDPLYFNYALQQMPENVIQALYPAYPAGIQNPIVPYSLNPSIYNVTGDMSGLSLYTPSYRYPNVSVNSSVSSFLSSYNTIGTETASILGATNSSSVFSMSEQNSRDFSNDWAVNGVKTSNTSALLANDPHLTTTVPSIWMGFQLVSPGENAIGVTFPSFPGIVLGHNSKIAWGATNGQIQETYFYAEKVNSTNSYEYLSNGTWTHFQIINETIPVKGGSSQEISVERADNGIVLENSRNGTIAMDWTGLSPSYELNFFLHIDSASTVNQFVTNLSSYFKVAIQNWAVAGSHGNIGIFPYGDYPIVKEGNPRGILPGTGAYNWVGFVPLNEEPHLHDPARGFVFSANQITVSNGYPYYIGWDYESGYRADEIYTLLNDTGGINTAKMENIQLTIHDFTTNILLPALVHSLKYGGLQDTSAYSVLSTWNGNMTTNSTAATIYYYWQQNILKDVFMPYLQKYGINSSEGLNQTAFFLGSDSAYHGPLIEDLVNWTMTDQNSSWFNNPVTGQSRNLTTVSLSAFTQTVSYLDAKYGNYSNAWEWGNIHKRYLSSLFGINQFNTNELPAAGDGNTINAAYGTVSDFGPSWRMVVNLSHPETARGIYPGGISENPLSKYYENTFVEWNDGTYYMLIPVNAPKQFLYMYDGGVSP